MSRTKRDINVLLNNWRFKSNRLRDFKAACVDRVDDELYGFRPKKRPLQNAYDDKCPSAIHEVKYLSQVK